MKLTARQRHHRTTIQVPPRPPPDRPPAGAYRRDCALAPRESVTVGDRLADVHHGGSLRALWAVVRRLGNLENLHKDLRAQGWLRTRSFLPRGAAADHPLLSRGHPVVNDLQTPAKAPRLLRGRRLHPRQGGQERPDLIWLYLDRHAALCIDSLELALGCACRYEPLTGAAGPAAAGEGLSAGPDQGGRRCGSCSLQVPTTA